MEEAREAILSAVAEGREKIKASFLRRFAETEEEFQFLLRLAEEWGLEVIW